MKTEVKMRRWVCDETKNHGKDIRVIILGETYDTKKAYRIRGMNAVRATITVIVETEEP